jgi:hypothetical protein
VHPQAIPETCGHCHADPKYMAGYRKEDGSPLPTDQLEGFKKSVHGKALLDKLMEPSGVSDEERMKRATAIIERAVANGLTEVQVYRFPNSLCTDHGRAINQQEPGWETTLTGLPKELYEFWSQQLRPLGYKLRVQIVDFPGGVPGDVGMTLKWV